MTLDEINKLIDEVYTDIFIDDKNKLELEEARPYLIAKGLDKYRLAADTMHKYYHDVPITYSNVSSFYKLDQRINDNFIKYFNMLEEYIRGQLCFLCMQNKINEIEINDTSACIGNGFISLVKEKNNFGNIYKKTKEKFDKKEIKVIDFFENLSFGEIKDFISNMKPDYSLQFEPDILLRIKDMRNETHHNRLLLSIKPYDEYLKIFNDLFKLLPGEDKGCNYKKGFLSSIKNLNVVFEKGETKDNDKEKAKPRKSHPLFNAVEDVTKNFLINLK